MHVGMSGEEMLQYVIVFIPLHIEWQIHLSYRDVGEVVAHIVSESRLTVFLLFACHITVDHLFHHHDFLFLRRYEHQHPACEISAAEGVLAEERQRAKVGHI